MKDKHGNEIVVGDYVYYCTRANKGKIIGAEDAWALDQWSAMVENIYNKTLSRWDVSQLEKIKDEDAMLLKLQE